MIPLVPLLVRGPTLPTALLPLLPLPPLLPLLFAAAVCDSGMAAGGSVKPLGGNTALNAAGGCVGWCGLTGALPGWLLLPLLPDASRLLRRLLL